MRRLAELFWFAVETSLLSSMGILTVVAIDRILFT